MAGRPDAAVTHPAVGGGCLCGAVRFEVEPPTLFCAHCHCSMCCRNHGAAFVTWFGIVRARLRLTAGSDALRRYPSSEHGVRSFCGRCGSSLFCASERHPEHVDVVLASLDGPIDRAPSAHFYFDSRAAWTDVRDDLPRLGGASGIAALAGADGEIRPGVWVGHVALTAPDPLAAARFFETLGLRLLERSPDFALLELRGGTHLLLFPGAAAAPGGIPKSTKGMLPWSYVLERMSGSRNYWIGTSTLDGHPHATPVWGVWLEDRLYFDGSPKTRRGRHLAANPNVVVHLESGDEAVIIHGRARDLKSPERSLTTQLSAQYSAKYATMGYEPGLETWEKGGLYEVQPSVVFAWTKFPKDATRWQF